MFFISNCFKGLCDHLFFCFTDPSPFAVLAKDMLLERLVDHEAFWVSCVSWFRLRHFLCFVLLLGITFSIKQIQGCGCFVC